MGSKLLSELIGLQSAFVELELFGKHRSYVEHAGQGSIHLFRSIKAVGC